MFLSPKTPRWSPSSEADIDSAIANGLLEENHWLELKREIENGRSANRELARDLASLAIDGGTLLVGVAEIGEKLALNPQPLTGLPERIEQIARSIPDPPLSIVTTAIPSASSIDSGYVLVQIPQSGQAPHMVDNKYLGRGDKTKIYLSDQEVLRLHERRRSSESDIAALLDVEVARDPLAGDLQTCAHLFLVAEPIPGRREMTLDIVSGSDWQTRMEHLRDQGLHPSIRKSTGLPEFSPDLSSAYQAQRRPHGAALSPQGLRVMEDGQVSLSESRAIELELSEDGQLRIYCGRISDDHNHNGYSHEIRRIVYDYGAIIMTRRLIAIAATIAESTGYLGNWGLGISITGLRGRKSFESTRSGFYSDAVTYGEDSYQRTAIASFADLYQAPGRLTHALVGRLLRALGTDRRLATALKDPDSKSST